MLAARTLTPSNTPEKTEKKKETSSGCRSRIASSRSRTSDSTSKRGKTFWRDASAGQQGRILHSRLFRSPIWYPMCSFALAKMTHHTGGGHVSGDIHPICICPAARRRTEAQAMLRMDAMPCLTSAVTPSTVVRFEGGLVVSNAGGRCASLAPCLPRGSLWLFEAWMQQ